MRSVNRELLRQLILTKGTVERVAVGSGLAAATIYKLRAGNNEFHPCERTRYKLCKYFKVSQKRLFPKEGNNE